jgi:hypothetical protein
MCLFLGKVLHFISDLESRSSTSSSTSESYNDAATLGSEEFGPMKFGESVCPEGCEQDLYDLTFVLRSQR